MEEVLFRESFPLEQVLALRGHLLTVKHDLKALPSVQLFASIGAAVEGSMEAADVSWGQLLVGLLPNPFAFLSAWKDLLVMAFCMRYRRRDVEEIYADMMTSAGRALRLSLAEQKKAGGEVEEVPAQLMQWMAHEQDILKRLGIKARDLNEIRDVREACKRAEKSMQRLLQALCFPHRLSNYRGWRGHELLDELRKAPMSNGLVWSWPGSSGCSKKSNDFAHNTHTWLLTQSHCANFRKQRSDASASSSSKTFRTSVKPHLRLFLRYGRVWAGRGGGYFGLRTAMLWRAPLGGLRCGCLAPGVM